MREREKGREWEREREEGERERERGGSKGEREREEGESGQEKEMHSLTTSPPPHTLTILRFISSLCSHELCNSTGTCSIHCGCGNCNQVDCVSSQPLQQVGVSSEGGSHNNSCCLGS